MPVVTDVVAGTDTRPTATRQNPVDVLRSAAERIELILPNVIPGIVDLLLAKAAEGCHARAIIEDPDGNVEPLLGIDGIEIHSSRRLAECRQKTHPTQALPVYWRLIDSALETADRRAYDAAVRLLKQARDGATAGGEVDAFEARLGALRERHRRRPWLIAMLDKAKLAPAAPVQ